MIKQKRTLQLQEYRIKPYGLKMFITHECTLMYTNFHIQMQILVKKTKKTTTENGTNVSNGWQEESC